MRFRLPLWALPWLVLVVPASGLPTGTTWTATYDETGLPIQETVAVDGKPFEVSELSFDAGLLAQRRVSDGDGKLLYTDRLYRWPDGRLRRLERDGPDAPIAQAAWIYGPQGERISSWTSDEASSGEHQEWEFRGSSITQTLLRGAEVLLTRVEEWTANGASQETKNEPALGRVTKRQVDEKGRVTSEVVTLKDGGSTTRTWTYDDQDRVVTDTTVGKGPAERWVYQYEAGGLVTAVLTRGGVLVREETTREGERIQVKLYDRGVLFLVETWKSDKLILQTYFEKGEAVRERRP